MMHLFPDGTDLTLPEQFTDPFRYSPHPLVRLAAGKVMEEIEGSDVLSEAFAEGKMLGVLIVKDEEGRVGYLQGFSGNVGGRSMIEGFVPPIFDLTQPGGHYRTNEAEISAINEAIKRLDFSEYKPLLENLQKANTERDIEIAELRNLKHDTVAESQFMNAEIKRAKDRWKTTIADLEAKVSEVRNRMSSLKKERARRSEDLQKWIFSQYVVHNGAGREATILEIFEEKGLIPPGGTGECAAPKLLESAFRSGLSPIAMGEFWYGQSPATAVRTHGHFYPSCTSKCGPLLGFMTYSQSARCSDDPRPLRDHPIAGGGMSSPHPSTAVISENQGFKSAVVYEDEGVIVVSKESGMPAVPGLDGRKSLQEWLSEEAGQEIHAVHRLDMDTSGIMIFAKSKDIATDLKKQFEEHTIRKTYLARLSPADTNKFAASTPVLNIGDTGRIELPLSADYDERPRQKVDPAQGKPSLTEYEISSVNADGTIDIIFHPHTGRTHQLRVHSAHLSGLGRPIVGDLLYGGSGPVRFINGDLPYGCSGPARFVNSNLLYGGSGPVRLHLHAYSITFRHPLSGELITLSTQLNCF